MVTGLTSIVGDKRSHLSRVMDNWMALRVWLNNKWHTWVASYWDEFPRDIGILFPKTAGASTPEWEDNEMFPCSYTYLSYVTCSYLYSFLSVLWILYMFTYVVRLITYRVMLLIPSSPSRFSRVVVALGWVRFMRTTTFLVYYRFSPFIIRWREYANL